MVHRRSGDRALIVTPKSPWTFPCDSLQGVAESECRRGCDAAEAAYVAAWAPGGEVLAEEAELEARHQVRKSTA